MVDTTRSKTIGTIGPHKYEIVDVRADKAKPHHLANWRKPARSTSFRPLTRGAPAINPISTFNMSQSDSPIVYRQMTPAENREQRIRNVAVAATAGAGTGATVQGASNMMRNAYREMTGAPKPRVPNEPGIMEQIRRQKRAGPIPMYQETPEGLAWHPEGQRLLNEHPLWRRTNRIPGGGTITENLASKYGNLKLPKERYKYAARQSVKGKAGPVLGALALGGASYIKQQHRKSRVQPYRAEYSTQDMKRLHQSPLG